jgi:hypothetical protein
MIRYIVRVLILARRGPRPHASSSLDFVILVLKHDWYACITWASNQRSYENK